MVKNWLEITSPQQKREGLVEYPQINIKLLSEEDRELKNGDGVKPAA
ncbi:hypothetical protein [Nostoc sp.]